MGSCLNFDSFDISHSCNDVTILELVVAEIERKFQIFCFWEEIGVAGWCLFLHALFGDFTQHGWETFGCNIVISWFSWRVRFLLFDCIEFDMEFVGFLVIVEYSNISYASPF